MSKIVIGSQAGNGSTGGGTVTVDFNPSVLFDAYNKYMSVTQTSDINITLAATGNIDHSNCTLVINPDNVHALTIDGTAFNVVGTIDKSQYNIISIYNPGLGIPPLAKILNLPKVSNYTRSFVTSNSAANVISLSNADAALDFAGDVPFSIMAWVKVLTLGIENNIVVKGNASAETYQFAVNANNGLAFGLFDTGGHYLFGSTTNGGVAANIWTHVAVTYDGSKLFSGIKFYINGSLVTATNFSSGTFGTINTVGSILVGSRPKFSTFGNFQIDHLAFLNIALNQTQITEAIHSGAGFNLTAASFSANLIAYYLFFNNLNDSSVNGTHTGSSTSSTYSTDAP